MLSDPQGRSAEDHALLSQLASWAAAHRQEAEAASRSRQGWLRRQAEETATWTGLLADLVEQPQPVTLALSSGRQLSGRLAAVGRDFVMLTWGHRSGLVRSAAICAVFPPVGQAAVPMGARAPSTLALDMAGALEWLCSEQSRVLVFVDGSNDGLSGRIRAVGADVVTLLLQERPARVAYVALASVVEVSLLLSG